MPKALPAGLEVRDMKQAYLPSLGEIVANAPDDGAAFQWDTGNPLYKDFVSYHIIQRFRAVMCDPTTLIKIAVLDGQAVAFSTWTRTELGKDGQLMKHKWRKATWSDGLDTILLGLEADYGNLIKMIHPQKIQANPSRSKAIATARARDPTPPEDQPCLQLTTIAVHPSVQGHGVGTLLVKWGMEHASDEGIPVYIKGEERGVGFYESLGFKRVPISEYWIRADGEEISRAEVENGDDSWKKENGGVSGAAVVWWPS